MIILIIIRNSEHVSPWQAAFGLAPIEIWGGSVSDPPADRQARQFFLGLWAPELMRGARAALER